MGIHFYTTNLSDRHTLLYYKSVTWAYTSILQICIHFYTTNLSHGHTLLYYKSVTWAYTSTLQNCQTGIIIIIHFYTELSEARPIQATPVSSGELTASVVPQTYLYPHLHANAPSVGFLQLEKQPIHISMQMHPVSDSYS